MTVIEICLVEFVDRYDSLFSISDSKLAIIFRIPQTRLIKIKADMHAKANVAYK